MELIGRAHDDLGDLGMDERNGVAGALDQPARHQPSDLVAPGIEIECGGSPGFLCTRAENGLLNPKDRGQVMALPHAGEELGDVRGVESLPQQLVDGLQLGQVVVVVIRRAALPARRVEQAAFPICADIARADTRDPRQIVQSILSQPNLACGHCSTGDTTPSEVMTEPVRM